jgi:hypothetical protein
MGLCLLLEEDLGFTNWDTDSDSDDVESVVYHIERSNSTDILNQI